MAAELKQQLQAELENFLRDDKRAVPRMLAKLEEATGVKSDKIVYGIAIAVAIYLVLGHGAELLCNTIGFAYPAYASFEAIETVNKDDDTQWLTYWTVFGTVSLIDFASDKIVGVFPIYWLVKCVFLLWLYVPFFRGAERLHRTAFGPAFKRLRPVMQGAQAEIQQGAMGVMMQGQALGQQPMPEQAPGQEPMPGQAPMEEGAMM